MNTYSIYKWFFALMGGGVGWMVGVFRPTFPLIVVAIIFILYDAYTAYLLDRRVHQRYPHKVQRKKANFTSFAFGKVVRQTIPRRLSLIILAYIAEKWVFIHVDWPLSYIITGVICFEQAWSILENESSCRDEQESRFWKILQRVMIDKTERHFDVDLEDLKVDGGRVTDEQVEKAREYLRKIEELKRQQHEEDTD